MSIRLMSIVWDIRWPTQNHLLVMLKLADHANDEGSKVWPAVATIADQAQCSERTVQNVLKAFRESGLVNVLKSGGGASPTIYALNVSLLNALAAAKAKLKGGADFIEIPDELYAQADNLTGAMVAPLAVAPVQPATGTGATEGGRGAKLLHPNHHLEPSKEPPTREGSNFDFEVKRPAVRFEITSTDPQWQHWMLFIRKRGPPDLEQRAIAAGSMIVVGSRWPKDDSPMPFIKRIGLTEKSERMMGG
jgi:hypothetical protein